MIATLPLLREAAKRALQHFLLRRIIRQPEGLATRPLQQFPVANCIGNVKAEIARLPRAEEFAWAAELQIGFGYLETIGRPHHRLQTCPRFFSHMPWCHQNAVRFVCSPPDTAPQLVKLG